MNAIDRKSLIHFNAVNRKKSSRPMSREKTPSISYENNHPA